MVYSARTHAFSHLISFKRNLLKNFSSKTFPVSVEIVTMLLSVEELNKSAELHPDVAEVGAFFNTTPFNAYSMQMRSLCPSYLLKILGITKAYAMV